MKNNKTLLEFERKCLPLSAFSATNEVIELSAMNSPSMKRQKYHKSLDEIKE